MLYNVTDDISGRENTFIW